VAARAATADAALRSTVIEKAASAEFKGLSGMSFQRVAGCWLDRDDMVKHFGYKPGDIGRYEDVPLPTPWKNFIGQLDRRTAQ